MISFFDFSQYKFVNSTEKSINEIKNVLETNYDFDILLDYQKALSFIKDINNIKSPELIINKCAYKIPGTDGVRAIANKNSTETNCLKAFLNNNELTPSFIKQYIKAFVKMLPSNIREIAVAEDGRELLNNNDIKKSVISALNESNLNIKDLEIIPTPLLVAYSVDNNIPAIMITASHNPPQYNGIKLFIDGRKLYPLSKIGEYQLTYNFFTADKQVHLKPVPPTVKTLFPINTFSKIFAQVDFESVKKTLDNTPLYLDLANGAFSKIAKNFLQQNDIKTIDLACNLGITNINENCGVALLEDLPFEVSTSLNPTINRLLNDGIKSDKDLYAIVCDGDGDRAFILKYSTKTKKGSIFNGDILGYIIAKGLKKENKVGDFCLTIESDFALANIINSELNWPTRTVGVGDRWLLDVIKDDTMFVGCERSGHVIVRNALFNPPLLSGNGLLTGLLALQFGLSTYSFGYGKKITSYTFPLDTFYNGSKSWEQIKNKILNYSEFKFRDYSLEYEYNVLIFKILDKADNEIGLIYVRKSGTEPKISISISTVIEVKKEAENLIKSLESEIT